MSDTVEQFEGSYRGIAIMRVLANSWPDGYCTVGFTIHTLGFARTLYPYLVDAKIAIDTMWDNQKRTATT